MSESVVKVDLKAAKQKLKSASQKAVENAGNGIRTAKSKVATTVTDGGLLAIQKICEQGIKITKKQLSLLEHAQERQKEKRCQRKKGS